MKWFFLFALICLFRSAEGTTRRLAEDDVMSVEEYLRKHPSRYREETAFYDVSPGRNGEDFGEISSRAKVNSKVHVEKDEPVTGRDVITPDVRLNRNSDDRIALPSKIHDEQDISKFQKHDSQTDSAVHHLIEKVDKYDDGIPLEGFVLRHHILGKGTNGRKKGKSQGNTNLSVRHHYTSKAGEGSDEADSNGLSGEYQFVIDDLPQQHHRHRNGKHGHKKKKSKDNAISKNSSHFHHHHHHNNMRNGTIVYDIHHKPIGKIVEIPIRDSAGHHHHGKSKAEHKKEEGKEYDINVADIPKGLATEKSENTNPGDFLQDLLNHFHHHAAHGFWGKYFNTTDDKSVKNKPLHYPHNLEEKETESRKLHNATIEENVYKLNDTANADVPVNYHVKFKNIPSKDYLRPKEPENQVEVAASMIRGKDGVIKCVIEDHGKSGKENKEARDKNNFKESGDVVAQLQPKNAASDDKYQPSLPKFKRIANIKQYEEEIKKSYHSSYKSGYGKREEEGLRHARVTTRSRPNGKHYSRKLNDKTYSPSPEME